MGTLAAGPGQPTAVSILELKPQTETFGQGVGGKNLINWTTRHHSAISQKKAMRKARRNLIGVVRYENGGRSLDI